MHAGDGFHHLVEIGGTHGRDVFRGDDAGHRRRSPQRLLVAGGNADHLVAAVDEVELIFVRALGKGQCPHNSGTTVLSGRRTRHEIARMAYPPNAFLSPSSRARVA